MHAANTSEVIVKAFLFHEYSGAAADEAFGGGLLGLIQTTGDFIAAPELVAERAAVGTVKTIDAILSDETSALEYLKRAGQSAEEFANAPPDEQAAIVGKGIGIATFAAVEVVVGSKGATKLASGRAPDVDAPPLNTGNDSVDDFVNTRNESNPQSLVDSEVSLPPANPNTQIFNALEIESLAQTLAQRNAQTLSDGSLIDNHGFVYTRNANGSVTSRVATQDQLAQSGVRLDFDNISTAKVNSNPPQSASPRNPAEQSAFEYIRANAQSGKILTSSDPRFKSNGFEKRSQSVPGPNGRNIEIHYQYNPTTGKIADIKVTSSIKNSQ